MKLKTLLTAIGLGAGAMYFYDPSRGNRRRAMVRDRITAIRNDIDDSFDVAGRDMRNRARGYLAELMARVSDEGAPDWIIEERVRASLGRRLRHAGAMDVRAEGGRVILSGPALRDEVDDVVKHVAAVRGVRGVDNQLNVYDTPGDLPSLQGVRGKMEVRPEFMQRNWSPSARLVSSVGGGILAAYGLGARKGLIGTTLGLAGLGMATRGVTNMNLKNLVGIGDGAGTVQVRKAINIGAPINEVYQYWSRFENFPRFMSHVKEVQDLGNGRSHWKVAGPAGTEVEFDAYTVRDIPNQLIAWETEPESQVKHAGFVRFDPSNDLYGTRVTVQMSYTPPAGAVGHAVAKMFGTDPKNAMDEDLVRLKSLLEQGETTAKNRKVRAEEVAPRTRSNEGGMSTAG